MSASKNEGKKELLDTIDSMLNGNIKTHPIRLDYPQKYKKEIHDLSLAIEQSYPGLVQYDWLAIRLLEDDQNIIEMLMKKDDISGNKHFQKLQNLIRELKQKDLPDLHSHLLTGIYQKAGEIAQKCVKTKANKAYLRDRKIDRILTSKVFGYPIMLLLLALILYITIIGANKPSALLAQVLFAFGDVLDNFLNGLHAPWWLTGFLIHGVYKGLAWVVSVMLPPMAIFFPLFTFLEDLGYLPRIAFNLDKAFRRTGAHGKQALTMGMGFGCNAAGVVSTRIIDSPKERLIAILTNTFVPCNGRWPLLILIATIFIAASVPAAYAGLVAVGTVFSCHRAWNSCYIFSKQRIKHYTFTGQGLFISTGIASIPPNLIFLRILYTSFIDRTIFVLWRAVIMAAPAGGIIWIFGNVNINDINLMTYFANVLDPIGQLIGLDGIILLAFIIAIPANEIVIPTIIMGYLAAGEMLELDSMEALRSFLFKMDGQ